MYNFLYKIYVLVIFTVFFILLGAAAIQILNLHGWWDIPMIWITSGAATFVTLHLTKEISHE